ncbi:hypothetical protein ACLBX9_28275 [Methylobacterium sp. A49B]|uniref:Uncharacterized protein n=1 Tax=Methylobacterium mesophilicum SR1.6/6 TaxID=908290 RepID=A0A6B9FEP2_9HYPH|nr:hypothetical protein [Methylobacterium mesophilicum]QGY00869.1 hypothetical protein MMSR116_02320 [Methylobacterium mesophilicum SR1.6/6]
MDWLIVVAAAYVVGGVVFWRLCRMAPVMPEDFAEDHLTALKPVHQPDQSPYQKADPRDHDDQDAAHDGHRAQARE